MNDYYSQSITLGFEESEFAPLSLLNFTRGVAIKNDASHLESRCNGCGFRLSALDEVLDSGEREHAAKCAGLTIDF
jgi:hypothetical protein